MQIGTTRGTGSANTYTGYNALLSNTLGNRNTGFGQSALEINDTFSDNSAVGLQSLGKLKGSGNTGLGASSGRFDSTGNNVTLATNSLFIGFSSNPLADNQSNQIVVGANTNGAGSNTATLGNTSIIKTVLRGAIQQTSYTVATLPTGSEGMFAYVTDATAPTYLGVLTGGGTIKCPVFFNGTAWVSH
jgi:hypothetical protein